MDHSRLIARTVHCLDLVEYSLDICFKWFVVLKISAPTGDRIHADIYNQGNGEYKVEWMPRMAGQIPKYIDIYTIYKFLFKNLSHYWYKD